MQKVKDNPAPKELLKQIEHVYQLADKHKNFDLLIQHGEQHLKPIAAFYSVSEFEALLLALIIYKHIEEKSITNRTLATIMGIPFVEMAEMVQTLKKLCRHDFIRSVRERDQGVKYFLHRRILLSTYSGKMVERNNKEDKTFAFINNMRCLSLERLNGDVISMELFQSAEGELEEAETLPFVQWIIKHQLTTRDVLVYVNACFEHIMEDKEIDVDLMLSIIFDSAHDRYLYKKGLASGSNLLFKNNLISWPKGELYNASHIILSEDTIEQLLSNQLETKCEKLTSKFFEVAEPGKITYEKLIYNSKEEKIIAALKHSLKAEDYNDMLTRLEEHNFKKGITILFHGYPGTGKTSTALQIARETGRVLLSADASELKGMWLGESEKNTRKIFNEYRRISKNLKEQPILLFNEADAILSNRIKVSRSIDQTLNTIQNILLQELENFEGIFIATTNLTNNLDHAFERRFLYKILFEKPSNDTVCTLLQNAFPEIAKEKLLEIASQFELTGSHIQNIKKKIQIRKVFENIQLTAEQIKHLAEEEFLTSIQRTNIGFIKYKN